MKIILFSSVALLACGVLLENAHATALLSDNFNSEVQLENYTNFANWNVTAGSVDVVGPSFVYDPFPGNGAYVDLDGSSPGNNPAGQLTSKLSFAAGTYTLSFDRAGNARGFAPKTTTVQLGDFLTSLTLASTDPFMLYSYTFTTTGGSLIFTETGVADNTGNLLDNVTVSATPIPAALPLFAPGRGVVGGLARRRQWKRQPQPSASGANQADQARRGRWRRAGGRRGAA
jgi:hypothetical protein